MIRFSAPEYQPDGSIRPAAYAFSGSPTDGWEVHREGRLHLRLGRGYRLLEVSHCGVCATDLARRHLPFPLPQVTGHEVVARDETGAPVVVEINASHAARGLAHRGWCPFCTRDLGTHCPERLVLGIHDLPGGFSPWLLAPVENVLPLPTAVSLATATLVEPFAAALHAVRTLAPADGQRVAVLGPRRLGALVVAALAAWRAQSGARYEIVALARRPEMRALARALGADDALDPSTMRDLVDVVVDTTGSSAGLELALRLARRELHVKSTTGQPGLGLAHLTELVVDELALVPWSILDLTHTPLPSPRAEVAALLGNDVPEAVRRECEARGLRIVAGDDAATLAAALARDPAVPLGAADIVVVTSLAGIDAAIRPRPDVKQGLVRARGVIAVVDVGQPRDALLAAILDRGLRLTTTRCGDMRAALALLVAPTSGLAQDLGEQMVTDRFPATRLADAFARAASPAAVKVLVTHPGALL
jgi:threonine dehydrogenase-like Zn-dependent dehydrogenase